MNKVILMGRLTRDPEVGYSNSQNSVATARFTLAVNRRFKREGEQDADFINCITFGKTAELIEKYVKKGHLISVTGRIQVRVWEDKSGSKRWSTDIVVEEVYFAESKKEHPSSTVSVQDEFYPMDETIEDDDLPF